MMKNCLGIKATLVANEFIDRYMAGANGEYVKVYLYLLRHENEDPDVGAIADALNHTEADVRRALGYWGRLGVLSEEADRSVPESAAGMPAGEMPGTAAGMPAGKMPGASAGMPAGKMPGAAAGTSGVSARMPSGEMSGAAAGTSGVAAGMPSGKQPGAAVRMTAGRVPEETARGGMPGAMAGTAPGIQNGETQKGRSFYTPEQVSRLADQEDFTQLLYISQKYMNKVFTPRECEVFAYLYDALHMPVDLLEYLVEYCVQNGHYSIRYLESVALNWHEKGICNVNMAKEYTASFSKEGFAVMRAFGISDRRPGESEQKLIDKWFKEFGFTRDIIIEACSRTLAAIHKPSFSYADKILSDWKKGGVRVLADVGKMDEKRESKKGSRNTSPVRPAKNQFHNFEQRGTDYDAMVLERLKERLGEQQG